MGSLAALNMADADATVPDIVVPKEEPFEDDYSDISVSTPEAGPELGSASQDVPPVQKRKGGRKPVSTLSWKSFRSTCDMSMRFVARN